MKTFLEIVAQDIIQKHGANLSKVAIVFPNKRASLFLNEHLARMAGQPLWSPAYITISDLFRKHSGLMIGDPIKLTSDLYHIYIRHTGSAETLDRFYGWGQLLLGDFDDIDKNMADASKVFANLKDLHELDSVDYLNEEQKSLLRRFFGNFGPDHESELKKRFLNLWSHLYDIYVDYNQLLESQGLAYEGSLYRKVATDENIQFKYDTYLFVGFNMMQKAERQLCLRLKKEGKAHFYWDFDHYYINGHEAGHYINQYLSDFPNELDNRDPAIYDNMGKAKDITYISATTENIQARYVAEWLREGERHKDGKRTAIVLADETLLKSVIHNLPPEVEKINITTGYPLTATPFYSLLRLLLQLQLYAKGRKDGKYRLREVERVLRHPYAKHISPKCQVVLRELFERKAFYPARLSLSVDEGTTLLFSDLERGTDSVTSYNTKLLDYLIAILRTIGSNSHEESDPLYQESLFRCYTMLNRLLDLMRGGDLDVDTATLERLIIQLAQSTTIPFHGEPAEGVQIMGVLETRGLDFEHLLVLSCNEGNLPRGVNDASFIPYAIRKAYGLTTIDNKVAIYAYYFHRMIQRCHDITLSYNISTEDGSKGQMSQFMLQLMVESGHPIHQSTLTANILPILARPKSVEKTAAIIEELDKIKSLSPTAINMYLRCPVSFFFRYVKHLKEADTIEQEEMDNRMFGNIFHHSAQELYLRYADKDGIRRNEDGSATLLHPIRVEKEMLEDLLRHPEVFEMTVDDAFRQELFQAKKEGYHPEYDGLQLINRAVILQYLKRLITIDCQLAPFHILGLEKHVEGNVSITTSQGEKQLMLGGDIDRLDCVETAAGKLVRVIDYKTGRPDSAPLATLEDIFTRETLTGKHPSYYLQTMLYALLVRNHPEHNPGRYPVSPALLYIQQTAKDDYDPILSIGKTPITDAQDYHEEYMEQLKAVITEMLEPSRPFLPTEDSRRCDSCPYAALCGL